MNNIKVTDLRVGNYVEEFNFGTVIICGVSKDCIQFHELDNTDVYYDENTALKPIPLTEEWLLKFGATKRTDKVFHIRPEWDNVIYKIAYSNGKWVFLVGFFEFTEIASLDHVHQLQNIYHSLTGEELILK